MNVPQELMDTLATFLRSVTNEDVIRDFCRRGRAAVGVGTILMTAGPIDMRFRVEHEVIGLVLRMDDHHWSMRICETGVSDDGIINRFRRFEIGRTFLAQTMPVNHGYTVEIDCAPDGIVVPVANVLPWVFDPRSVTSLRLTIDMSPPPLWKCITVREPLPEVIRAIIMRFADLRSMALVMGEIFEAARKQGLRTQKLVFRVLWTPTNRYLTSTHVMRACIRRNSVGEVGIEITYSVQELVYRRILVRRTTTLGWRDQCAISERILSGGYPP